MDHVASLTSSRRTMLKGAGSAFAALLATSQAGRALAQVAGAAAPYDPLQKDPQALIDLPSGFSYRVISRMGDAMDDGGTVPDRADGMGCFALANGKIALVRNHE